MLRSLRFYSSAIESLNKAQDLIDQAMTALGADPIAHSEDAP